MPTQQEIAFLKAQRIPESLVFHGGGLARIYMPIMEEQGAILIPGSSPWAILLSYDKSNMSTLN